LNLCKFDLYSLTTILFLELGVDLTPLNAIVLLREESFDEWKDELERGLVAENCLIPVGISFDFCLNSENLKRGRFSMLI
jgi:hypothetical protein